MKLFEKIFRKKDLNFSPDLFSSEYDNWLNFLAAGGTSEEWEKLKAHNNWIFPESETEKFQKYQKDLAPISDKYYFLLEKIQRNWSVLFKSKNYHSHLADEIEKDCLTDIAYYEQLLQIDAKHGEKSFEKYRVPALERLALLYQRQKRYEEAIAVCKKACTLGKNEASRMEMLLKKIGREPTPEEILLIHNFYQMK